MEEETKTLRRLNSNIRDCIHSINEILYQKLEITCYSDEIEILELCKTSYLEHISRVQESMSDYLKKFRQILAHGDPLNDFLGDYAVLSTKWENLTPDEWYVPPPFHSSTVSKLRIPLRYRHFVRYLTAECTKVGRKSKNRFYYFPHVSTVNAETKLVVLQQKLHECSQELPYILDGIQRLKNKRTDLLLEVERLQTYVSDEYLLFSSMPEYEAYTDEIRSIFTQIRDSQNPQETLPGCELAFFSFQKSSYSLQHQINVIKPVDVHVSAFSPLQ